MRHVALLIETSREFGRGLLRGVARFKQENGHWLTYCRPHGLGDMSYTWLRDWKGDAILARITNRRMASSIARLKVPVVNLRGKLADLPFPYVGVDDAAVARTALEHLLVRGFRHFGFCGYRRGYSAAGDRRCDAFVSMAQEFGGSASVCNLSDPEPTYSRELRSWKQELALVARWIRSLPRPSAVMACTDDRGLLVLEACRQVGVAVPDEIAVIGVSNDDCLCALSIPPLTSVDVAAENIGYQAAALLDNLMDGGKSPGRVLIAPQAVVCRQSTDTMAVGDQSVAGAIRFIREHACEPITIGDVAAHVHVSSSVLEQRLKQAIGRTIHKEIQRTRISRVQQMLTETSLPLKMIAHQTGFSSIQYMTRAFRSATRLTPGAYRRQNRP